MYFKLLKIVFILGVFILGTLWGNQSAFALAVGDAVPAENNSAVVKVGQIAPKLVFPQVDEQVGNLDFKTGIPTVILSIRGSEDMEKLQEFQKFYELYKERIHLYVITGGDREEVIKRFKTKNLTLPVIMDSTIHFIRKYNNGVPAMMITDGEGKVVYNSSFFIEINSLERYMDKLIAGETELPNLSFVPPVQKHFEPKTIKLGTVLTKEKFKDLDDNDVEIVYGGKPTVLLFWLSITTPENLEKYMGVMEESVRKNGNKANFYTVVASGKKEFVLKVLDEHHSTIPALVGSEVFLNYSLAFPSIVIIDAQGVLRYRPVAANPEELQRLLDECQTPYEFLPEPQNAEEWAKRGDSLLEKHNFLEAIDAYDRCLALDSKVYLAYVKRGLANDRLLRYKNAYSDFSQAIVLNPKEISNYYSRAEVSKNLRQFSQMVADYTQIIALNSKEAHAYLYRGNYYLQNRQLDLAIEDYTKVIECAPQEVDGYLKRGDSYLSMKQYAEAIKDYNRVVALNPKEAKGYYGRGIICFEKNQFGQAVDELSKAIVAKPEASYYYLRGVAYYRQGKSDLTISDFTKVIELTPNDGYPYYQRGIVYSLRNEYPEAIEDFNAATKFNPRNGEIAFALAQCLERNQEQDKALEAYKIALEYLPQFKKTLVAKAQCRVDGDWQSYREWIQ